jgi:K+-transporting ATPase KdpF subunit
MSNRFDWQRPNFLRVFYAFNARIASTLISIVLRLKTDRFDRAECDDGYDVLTCWHWLLRDLYRAGASCVPGDTVMTVAYVISAVLVGVLLIYLFVAMLKPEWF